MEIEDVVEMEAEFKIRYLHSRMSLTEYSNEVKNLMFEASQHGIKWNVKKEIWYK